MVEWIVCCLSEWIVCLYEIDLDPHVVWTPCFMIFRPFVGLPVMYIPNISPRIDCDFAERVGVRHSLVRVITEILGTCRRAFRQPRFEQNLNGFRHHASRLIEVSVCEEQLGDIRSSLGRGLTRDLSMGVSLNLCDQIDTWTALLERCHSYPGGTSIRVGFRSTLVSFTL